MKRNKSVFRAKLVSTIMLAEARGGTRFWLQSTEREWLQGSCCAASCPMECSRAQWPERWRPHSRGQ